MPRRARGHDAGDLVLREVSARLLTVVREPDSVARLGEDKFAILLEHVGDDSIARRVARRALHEIEKPIPGPEAIYSITTSIGVAIYPRDGQDALEVLRSAEADMAGVKRNGGGAVSVPEHRATAASGVDEALQQAIDSEEFELFFQPILDTYTGKFTTMEALIRWRRADGSIVAPGGFIPALENSGMIQRVGRWVVDAACEAASRWRDDGLEASVAVNLSPRQLEDTELAPCVQASLIQHGITPAEIEFELTESVLMQDRQMACRVLDDLRAMGFRIAVDDFGTGYSSLSYLKRLPVDVLKIDREFVSDLQESAASRRLVEGIVSLARRMGLEVVAEGVETNAQLDLLRGCGCDRVQGYLFSRPIAFSETTALLREGWRSSMN